MVRFAAIHIISEHSSCGGLVMYNETFCKMGMSACSSCFFKGRQEKRDMILGGEKHVWSMINLLCQICSMPLEPDVLSVSFLIYIFFVQFSSRHGYWLCEFFLLLSCSLFASQKLVFNDLELFFPPSCRDFGRQQRYARFCGRVVVLSILSLLLYPFLWAWTVIGTLWFKRGRGCVSYGGSGTWCHYHHGTTRILANAF